MHVGERMVEFLVCQARCFALQRGIAWRVRVFVEILCMFNAVLNPYSCLFGDFAVVLVVLLCSFPKCAECNTHTICVFWERAY